jgi:hypothetical protein
MPISSTRRTPAWSGRRSFWHNPRCHWFSGSAEGDGAVMASGLGLRTSQSDAASDDQGGPPGTGNNHHQRAAEDLDEGEAWLRADGGAADVRGDAEADQVGVPPLCPLLFFCLSLDLLDSGNDPFVNHGHQVLTCRKFMEAKEADNVPRRTEFDSPSGNPSQLSQYNPLFPIRRKPKSHAAIQGVPLTPSVIERSSSLRPSKPSGNESVTWPNAAPRHAPSLRLGPI